jgi:hypothetical protein
MRGLVGLPDAPRGLPTGLVSAYRGVIYLGVGSARLAELLWGERHFTDALRLARRLQSGVLRVEAGLLPLCREWERWRRGRPVVRGGVDYPDPLTAAADGAKLVLGEFALAMAPVPLAGPLPPPREHWQDDLYAAHFSLFARYPKSCPKDFLHLRFSFGAPPAAALDPWPLLVEALEDIGNAAANRPAFDRLDRLWQDIAPHLHSLEALAGLLPGLGAILDGLKNPQNLSGYGTVKEGSPTPSTDGQPASPHNRPALEKHKLWARWHHEDGLSYQRCADKHKDETGEDVTWHAVHKAVKRLNQGPER